MLKGIPKILSPELLKVLAEMGHSDRLVISDGNFPAESMGKDAIVIRCDGHGVPEILDAILQVFPLDSYVEHPVNLMEVMPGDTVETPIWDTYKEIIRKYDDRGDAVVGNIERFAFYDEAKTAYAIIATGESALYANVMLQKGVVTDKVNMEAFIENHGHYFREMTEYTENASDKETAAKELAVDFTDKVYDAYVSPKKGKIDSAIQTDLNFFMIYYVFPAILLTEHDDAKLIADHLCSRWGEKFKNSKIQYTDYDSLYVSFREKIFGIF